MSNNITITGNLTADPEMEFTQSGVGYTRFTIASNRKWKDKNDEWQEDTAFFRGTVWRDDAERLADSLRKGDRVIATGRMDQNDWEDKEGNKRSSLEFNVYEIGPSLKYATAAVTRAQKEDRPTRDVPPPVPRDDYGPDSAPF